MDDTDQTQPASTPAESGTHEPVIDENATTQPALMAMGADQQQQPAHWAAADYMVDEPILDPEQYIGDDHIQNTEETVTLRQQDGPKYMNQAVYELDDDIVVTWTQYPDLDGAHDMEDTAPAITDSVSYVIELEIGGYDRDNVDDIDDHLHNELSDLTIDSKTDKMFY